MIRLKPFVGLGTVWTRLNDYNRAKWKLTGIYILIFFVLLNLFTISLFVMLQRVEAGYIKKTNTVWQQKKIIFPEANITVLEWNVNSDGFSKQEVEQFYRDFLTDIKHRVIVIEIILLILAGIASYFLAKKTLKPIEKKNKLQKQFLADVSHELKNPLSSLKMNIEIAKKQENLSKNEMKEILNDLEEEVDRLNKMTQDLLMLENIENNKKKEFHNIGQIVKKQIVLLKPLAKKRNIKIRVKLSDCVIKVDKRAVEQVVYNLIHNAIKFSHPNGVVQVTLTKEGKLLVRDRGVGMDIKDLPHIFERFYKVDDSRTFTNDSGSGLGLAIVKRLADNNGWKISVKSEINKGTTFQIFLK